MIIPQRLRKGDTIALLSPSAGLASLFPHRVETARKFLESEGFRVKEYPTTRGFLDGTSGTLSDRVRDLHEAFRDPVVRGIVCTIGGLYCNELLESIDFDLVRKNPKVFCGYSDISILHCAFYRKAGLRTFYGPCAMTQFGEHPKPLTHTVDYFRKATMSTTPIGNIPSSTEWTEELLDWAQQKDLSRPRTLQKNTGYEWLREGTATGKIVGGCLHSILQLRGTEYDVEYDNNILFLETPEGQEFTKGEPVGYIRSQLTTLKISGAFKNIRGLIIGRFYKQPEEDEEKLKTYVKEITKNYSFPILYGTDIGHTDPQITIPLGAITTLNSTTNTFSIEEAGVL